MTREPLQDQLGGFRILVTAHRRAAELGAALTRRGAEVLHAPVLSIVPHVDDDELLARTEDLLADPPDVVVVTTGVGFRGWIEAADAAGRAADLHRVLEGARIVARGPKARGAIQAAGLVADWVAESETSAEIRDLLLSEGVDGVRIAVQHHGAGADGLDEALSAAGAVVRPLVVYRWGPAPDPEAVSRGLADVAARRVDAVVFTSAPGAHAFLVAAADAGLTDDVLAALEPRGPVLAAAVGPVTAAPLEAVGVEPLVPDRYRMGALVREVVAELSARSGAGVDTPDGRLLVLRHAARLGGHALALSPGGLAVLRLLVEANGGVVTRAAILAALPGESTDPHTAEVAVARLREALPRRDLVRTVVKRGYRLDLPTPAPAAP